MDDKEKIYLEYGDVKVTSSRVVLGDQTFVLRNISSTKVFEHKDSQLGIIFAGVIGAFGIVLSMVSLIPGLICFVAAIAVFFMFSDSYSVRVTSGGTAPSDLMSSKTKDDPEKIVNAINQALLDLDSKEVELKDSKTSTTSQKTAAEEIKDLKELLDSGALTQEEFDAKKKELLGL